MKIYKGKRLGGAEGIPWVRVTVNGKPLEHHVCHSPTGFGWGHGGDGPADLARSILWDFIGAEPTPSLYQDFKYHFVLGWKDTWEITSEEIQNWMNKKGANKGKGGQI